LPGNKTDVNSNVSTLGYFPFAIQVFTRQNIGQKQNVFDIKGVKIPLIFALPISSVKNNELNNFL